MPLSEQEYKDLILSDLPETTDGRLALNVDVLWTRFDTITDLEAHYLSTRLAAIDLLLGAAAQLVSFRTSSGSSVQASDVFDHLTKLRELAVAAIGGTSASGSAAGQLTATAPIDPPFGAGSVPDANDRAYRGDPYRSRKRWGP